MSDADQLSPDERAMLEFVAEQAERLVRAGLPLEGARGTVMNMLYATRRETRGGPVIPFFTSPEEITRKVTEIIVTATQTGLRIENVAIRWRFLDEVRSETGVSN